MHKEIYKFNLYIVSEDIHVDIDLKKSTNIKNAKMYDKTIEILAIKSHNKKYFKELITGRKIPVLYVENILINYNDYVKEIYPNEPYFIKFNVLIDKNNFTKSNRLQPVSLKEVKDYLNQHIEVNNNYEKFSYELDQIIKTAESRYNLAASKNEISEEKQLKILIKQLRKIK